MLPYLQRAGLPGQNGGEEPAADDLRREVTRLAQAAGEHIKTAGDILDYDFFFLPCDRLPCNEKALQKWLHRPGARDIFRKNSATG